jgi:hypothetical protein
LCVLWPSLKGPQAYVRAWLHEFLCCILHKERRMPDWFQDIIDHQVGRRNYCTLCIGRIVCQVWRLVERTSSPFNSRYVASLVSSQWLHQFWYLS